MTLQRRRLMPQASQDSSHELVRYLFLSSVFWSFTQAAQSAFRSLMTEPICSSVLHPANPVCPFEPKVTILVFSTSSTNGPGVGVGFSSSAVPSLSLMVTVVVDF